jgi:hypothetical protein
MIALESKVEIDKKAKSQSHGAFSSTTLNKVKTIITATKIFPLII